MRRGTRIILVVAISVLLIALTTGIAIAVTKTCTASPCKGTDKRDLLFEQAGTGVADNISGKDRGDTIDANGFGGDTDVVKGNRGSDVLYINDGDTLDTASGGKGKDTCVVDAGETNTSSCTVVVAGPGANSTG